MVPFRERKPCEPLLLGKVVSLILDVCMRQDDQQMIEKCQAGSIDPTRQVCAMCQTPFISFH